MKTALRRLWKSLMGATLALCLGLSLILTGCGSVTKTPSILTGDYAKDTIAISIRLKETIAMEQGTSGTEESGKEAIALIEDYMSIYRNRQKVNKLNSFTTMQTVLNSLAGHYRNFSNRPLPEELKERVNNELTKAEISLEREA